MQQLHVLPAAMIVFLDLLESIAGEGEEEAQSFF